MYQTRLLSKNQAASIRSAQKTITKTDQIPLISLDEIETDNRMNIENDWEQLELQLNPDRDYIPSCFLSQESNKVSSQVSQGTLEELLAPISSSSHDNWSISNDPMYESSVTLSPTSLPQSPAGMETSKTTAEELIDQFLPSSQNSGILSDDDLDDLVQIIAEKEGVYPPEPTPEDSLPGCVMFYEDAADSLAYAISSQVQTGFVIQHDPNYSSQEPVPELTQENIVDENKTPAKRGRKRKNSDCSASGDDCFGKKKKQNAEAAKRYRQKKRQEDDIIFEEREKMNAELQKTKKLFLNKMNERNILLKMLYEAYNAKDSTVREKFGNIKWPQWLPKWYEKQLEREEDL